MHRIAVILIVCFELSVSTLNAQQFAHNYLDSVRVFFRDFDNNSSSWHGRRILDDAVFLDSHLDSGIMHVGQGSDLNLDILFRENFSKVYKIDRSAGAAEYPNYLRTDSLKLSENEVKAILAQMQNPNIRKWDSGMIPFAKIVTHEEIVAYYQPYFDAQEKLSNYLKDPKRDKDHIDQDPEYKKFNEIRKKYFASNGGNYKYFDPVFIKQGRYAAMFFYSYEPPLYIGYWFSIYKNENGHWVYFGNIFRGNIN